MVIAAAIILGALAMWLPVVGVELASGPNYNIVLVNLLPVACTSAVYVLARRLARWPKSTALYMLLGGYAFAPSLLLIAASSSAGVGFRAFVGARGAFYFALVSLFPPLTWILVGYNGTLLGMLAATGVLFRLGTKGSPTARRLWNRYRGRRSEG